MEGLIFDIEKFAVHDGPGIRTTVFVKGCPLRCVWCHNPEGISPKPEVVFFRDKCIGCKRCFEACSTGALRLEGDARVYESHRCVLCGRCAEACFAEAQVVEGRSITAEDALAEIERDRPFYENSGGGMTVSGGEPMAQKAFVKDLLKRCKERGIHTALDTCGHAPWEDFREVLPFVDLILFDIKVMDPAQHERTTGVDNALILGNLRKLDREKAALWIRIPVVPGYNDTEENFEATAAFLRDLASIQYVELLPYHGLAESKYERMNQRYTLRGIHPPTEEKLQALEACLKRRGLPVKARWAASSAEGA
jgi:pyruvate formate lyase activating enzyme